MYEVVHGEHHGFYRDIHGRRWFVTAGLAVCTLGLVIIAATGDAASDPVGGVAVGALFLGLGASAM